MFTAIWAPQWSQPKIGWMTKLVDVYTEIMAMPQWSQPKIGWMTFTIAFANAPTASPQWSQPKIGWMTPPRPAPARRLPRGRNGASRRSAG